MRLDFAWAIALGTCGLLGLGTAAEAAANLAEGGAKRSCEPSEYAADTFAPTPAFPGQTRAPPSGTRLAYRTEVVAGGLVHPWAFAFLPDGQILVTDRPGRVRVVSRSGQLSPPIVGVPKVTLYPSGDGGIHDILLDPDFASNRVVYLATNELAPGQAIEPGKPEKIYEGVGRVLKVQLSPDSRRFLNLTTLHTGAGGARRLAFAADGTLLVSFFAANESSPQSMKTDEGKILRIRTDGAAPKDNPWASSVGAKPEIYAVGIRDAQGLFFDRTTQTVWEIEHGPRGGDELNVIHAGGNYGYPVISYGREYTGELINGGLTVKHGMEQPIYYWTPDIAPSGLLVYSGNLFPEWRGNIFIGALAAKSVVRLQIENGHVKTQDVLLHERCQRIRDVRQGPEGAIYLLTDEDDGQILRLLPES